MQIKFYLATGLLTEDTYLAQYNDQINSKGTDNTSQFTYGMNHKNETSKAGYIYVELVTKVHIFRQKPSD